jgi:DNA-binding LacI/PurR family transcriptional regulator
MTTIKDVARAANLSVTTASRALNNHSDVAAATRARVAEVAERLGYHPNHTARSLQGTRTDTVGLVIPRLVHRYVDSFWLEFIGGVSAACTDAGLDLLISMADDLHGEHAHYQRLVRSRRVDGVILCDIRVRDPRIAFLRDSPAPFVAFGRMLGDADYTWVDIDGAAGVHQAMNHLLALGHRRVAFLGTDRDFSFSHFRHEGYLSALLAAGLRYDESLVIQDLAVGSDLEEPLDRLLALPSPPTAFLTCADFLASAALRSLRRRGLLVPEDCSLVAFDDTLITQHAEPPLSCIRQDNQAAGICAAKFLIRQLQDGLAPPTQQLLQATLIVRQSTAAVPS